ncbi:hypothetical protein D3C75_1268770 [compost metagenome]
MAVIDRSEYADCGVKAGTDISHRDTNSHGAIAGVFIAVTGHRHHPGHGLDQVVIA